MRRLTRLEKFGIIAAIVVCGTYFYMGRVYDPEAKSLARTVNKLNAAIKKYNEMEEAPPVKPIEKSIEQRQKDLEEITARLKKAGGRTDDPAEITSILADITGLARENRITVVKISPEPEEKDNLLTWAVFKAELLGNYHDFRMFIRQLRRLPQPVKLRDLEIKCLDHSGTITINLTLLI